MDRTGVALAVDPVRAARALVGEVDEHETIRQAQRRLDRVGHAARIGSWAALVLLRSVAHDETVDDDVDAVLVLLVEADLLVQLAQVAVNPHAHEARLLRAGQHLLVLALPVAHEWRHDHEPGPVRQVVEPIDDLLHRLPLDLATADGAMHAPDAREEEAQVVIDLGDRADGRARVLGRALLVDADRRREPVDLVDVGLLHLPQELAGIGRQRLDVAALPFGIDRVERQAGLARSGQPGDDDEPVARHLDVDRFEVVLTSAADDDPV